MANHWRRIVFPVTGSATTQITGSIYKVCMGDPQTTSIISSASFGWQNKGTTQLDPAGAVEGLKFTLNGTGSNVCVEADFTHISCSIGTHVYIKTNGGQGWMANDLT